MINQNFVFLGAIINLIGSTNYVYHTLKGRTKPNRVTWFLWALAPMIAFIAMLGQGVDIKTSLMTFMVGFGPLIVFIASFINKNSIWNITKFDIVCGVLSLLGLAGWAVTRTGDIAIIFSIAADALACVPTLVKAFKEPETESPLLFFNGSISAVITLLTIKSFTLTNAGFTVYILFACLLLFITVQFKLGSLFSKSKS